MSGGRCFSPGFAGFFLALNSVFSLIYWLGDDPVANVKPGSLADLFFFSIETLATVGYGDMHPQTTYGHIVATAEIFTGMSIVAVMTGLVFARFSRPRSRILFADSPVIGLHDGALTFMVRIANARHNAMTEATAKLWFARREITAEGGRFRRFHQLPIDRDQNPLFALSWTLFHIIDERSVLLGADAESLRQSEASFIVTFNGIDEQSAQSIFARHSYDHDRVRWHHRYVDIIERDAATNENHIYYDRFHETEGFPPAA